MLYSPTVSLKELSNMSFFANLIILLMILQEELVHSLRLSKRHMLADKVLHPAMQM